MAVGNNKGLVLPYTTTDYEFQNIVNLMPDSVRVHRLDSEVTGNFCHVCKIDYLI